MAKSSLTRESKKEHDRKDVREGSMMKKKYLSSKKNATELQVHALEDFEGFVAKVSAIFGEGYEELVLGFLDAFGQDDQVQTTSNITGRDIESFLAQKVDFMADDYSNNISTPRSEAVADTSGFGAGDEFLGDYLMGVFDNCNHDDCPEWSEDIDRFLAENIDF